MNLDGARRDVELHPYLLVGLAAREQARHFELAFREPVRRHRLGTYRSEARQWRRRAQTQHAPQLRQMAYCPAALTRRIIAAVPEAYNFFFSGPEVSEQ
jgi:hypothetical protein